MTNPNSSRLPQFAEEESSSLEQETSYQKFIRLKSEFQQLIDEIKKNGLEDSQKTNLNDQEIIKEVTCMQQKLLTVQIHPDEQARLNGDAQTLKNTQGDTIDEIEGTSDLDEITPAADDPGDMVYSDFDENELLNYYRTVVNASIINVVKDHNYNKRSPDDEPLLIEPIPPPVVDSDEEPQIKIIKVVGARKVKTYSRHSRKSVNVPTRGEEDPDVEVIDLCEEVGEDHSYSQISRKSLQSSTTDVEVVSNEVRQSKSMLESAKTEQGSPKVSPPVLTEVQNNGATSQINRNKKYIKLCIPATGLTAAQVLHSVKSLKTKTQIKNKLAQLAKNVVSPGNRQAPIKNQFAQVAKNIVQPPNKANNNNDILSSSLHDHSQMQDPPSLNGHQVNINNVQHLGSSIQTYCISNNYPTAIISTNNYSTTIASTDFAYSRPYILPKPDWANVLKNPVILDKVRENIKLYQLAERKRREEKRQEQCNAEDSSTMESTMESTLPENSSAKGNSKGGKRGRKRVEVDTGQSGKKRAPRKPRKKPVKKVKPLETDNGFRCTADECSRSFETEFQRDVHYRQKHLGDVAPYHCSIADCNKKFKSAPNLRDHEMAHKGERNYICEECGYAAFSPSALKTHSKLHTFVPYNCPDCGVLMERFGAVKLHRQQHSGRLKACPVCGKTFRWQAKLNDHLRKHPELGIPLLECSLCDKKFMCQKNLKNHRQIVHEGTAKYKCSFEGCKYMSNGFSQVQMHEKLHQDTFDHLCDHCGKGFKSKTGLAAHVQVVHKTTLPGLSFYSMIKRRQTGQRSTLKQQHLCSTCGKSLSTVQGLKIHERIHTGEKPYACDVCEKRYRGQSQLLQHKESHRAVKHRRFKCDKCEKGFATKDSLQTHTLFRHEGIKLHKCTFGNCTLTFTNAGNLKKHVDIVHLDKRQECPICGKKLSLKYLLDAHLRVHRGEKPYAAMGRKRKKRQQELEASRGRRMTEDREEDTDSEEEPQEEEDTDNSYDEENEWNEY